MSDRRVKFASDDAVPAAAAPRASAPGPAPAPAPGEGLMVQDLATLDPSKLTAISPEVISRQATINIGTIGHVAHGKSTVVKALSGVKTVRFKSELVRNITIKLGYANAKIYVSVDAPYVYESRGSSHPDTYVSDSGRSMRLVRHVSFVPQTSEHLAAVEIMRLEHIIILQNKIDLVKEDAARAQHAQIKAFVANTVAGEAPIIPISAQLKYNIEFVAQHIATTIPVPMRDFTSTPRLIVIRSFDVNKPGEEVAALKGGVAGGSILQGVLVLGSDIELRPGVVTRASDGTVRCTPIYSRVLSLFAETNPLQFAVPGGLIGVGTSMDPTLTRADRLVGQVLGLKGHLPDVFVEIEVSFYLLKRLLGVKTNEGEKAAKVTKLAVGEVLMVNIGSTSTGGKVLRVKADAAKIELMQPVCTKEDEKIALSRRVEKHWRLIGWGKIRRGVTLEVGADGVAFSRATPAASREDDAA